MPARSSRLLRRKTRLLAADAILTAGAVAAWHLPQATAPTIAVALRDGTAPERITAYADALEAARENGR